MKEDILESDCLPDPPTPISMAFPLGCSNILDIRKMCWMVSRKKTSSNRPLISTLYSYILDYRNSLIFLGSSSNSYCFSPKSTVKMQFLADGPVEIEGGGHESICQFLHSLPEVPSMEESLQYGAKYLLEVGLRGLWQAQHH
ncbi:unnamed protein product [Sphagnum balticum]